MLYSSWPSINMRLNLLDLAVVHCTVTTKDEEH